MFVSCIPPTRALRVVLAAVVAAPLFAPERTRGLTQLGARLQPSECCVRCAPEQCDAADCALLSAHRRMFQAASASTFRCVYIMSQGGTEFHAHIPALGCAAAVSRLSRPNARGRSITTICYTGPRLNHVQPAPGPAQNRAQINFKSNRT